MIILGLTGSIGMGKTTAAENFRRQGVPVHDADRTVHELLAKNGEAVELIEKQFPGSEKKGAIDREKIAGEVFNDPEALARIESILHPMVKRQERSFLEMSTGGRIGRRAVGQMVSAACGLLHGRRDRKANQKRNRSTG